MTYLLFRIHIYQPGLFTEVIFQVLLDDSLVK